VRPKHLSPVISSLRGLEASCHFDGIFLAWARGTLCCKNTLGSSFLRKLRLKMLRHLHFSAQIGQSPSGQNHRHPSHHRHHPCHRCSKGPRQFHTPARHIVRCCTLEVVHTSLRHCIKRIGTQHTLKVCFQQSRTRNNEIYLERQTMKSVYNVSCAPSRRREARLELGQHLGSRFWPCRRC